MNWREKRNRILAQLKDTQLELRPPRRHAHDAAGIRALRGTFALLLGEYIENVPFVSVSRCPICEEEFAMPIDTEGLDSPWWWDQCPVDFPRPRACEHFRVFLGAVDLHGRQPAEVDVWAVLPGPGAPFVIERLLSMDGMQAVISSFTVGRGDTAYLISYFSAEPISPNELHQEWRKQTWIVYDEDGNAVAQDLVNDPWEFDLEPWISENKVAWIEPNDPTLVISRTGHCPYVGLSGCHEKQILGSGSVKFGAPPDGSEPEYYAPYD